MTEDILQEILVQDSNGELFYRFANADGKMWIMPARNLRTAMELYQPSGWKGRLLKRWFPILHRLRIVRSVVHAEEIRCRMNDELRRLLEKVLETENMEFSIFCGTPSEHKKITIQIFLQKRIFGYAKFSDKLKVASLFQHESEILKEIRELGVKNVPEPKFYGKKNGIYIFVQTTTKTRKSKICHHWTIQHTLCIDEIIKKTRQKIAFEKTDFFMEIQKLKNNLNLYEEKDQSSLAKGIQFVSDYYSKKNEYCFFHGDFTPWNMYMEDNKIYLFDMEYSCRLFPPYMDMLHFVMQVCIQEKHKDSKQIIREIERSAFIVKSLGPSYQITIIAYLLFILSFYMQIYTTRFNSNDNGYRIWTALLKHYIKS